MLSMEETAPICRFLKTIAALLTESFGSIRCSLASDQTLSQHVSWFYYISNDVAYTLSLLDSNPRHTHQVKTEVHKSKDVFKSFINEDTSHDFLAANNDLQHLSPDGLNASEAEITNIKRNVQMNMVLIKEIYVHLQGLSSCYPYIDHYTFR